MDARLGVLTLNFRERDTSETITTVRQAVVGIWESINLWPLCHPFVTMPLILVRCVYVGAHNTDVQIST